MRLPGSNVNGNNHNNGQTVTAVSPPLASPEHDTSSHFLNNNKEPPASSNKSTAAAATATTGGVAGDDSTLNLSQVSSTSSVVVTSVSVSPIVCRICYSTCGTLFAFCKCKGSVGYVHKECLKRWIDAKLKANRCEICQAPFSGTDWSFKPLSKWSSPKMGVLDKLYLALFICCSIIVLYSIPWITYKAWRSRDVIFGDGPVTSERIFALIVIAIYIPLNISCVASLVVLWRRAVSAVCQRFLDTNKMWRVRITREVAATRLINAVNSTGKSPSNDDRIDCKENCSDNDSPAMTPIKRLDGSPRRPVSRRPSNIKISGDDDLLRSSQTTEEAVMLIGGETSGDSSTMLISGQRTFTEGSMMTTDRHSHYSQAVVDDDDDPPLSPTTPAVQICYAQSRLDYTLTSDV